MTRFGGVGVPTLIRSKVVVPAGVDNVVRETTLPSLPPTHRWSTRVIDLTNARDNEIWDVRGSLIWAHDASSNTAKLLVRQNDEDNGFITVYPGISLVQSFFNRLYLSNEAQSSETITVSIALEQSGVPAGIEI